MHGTFRMKIANVSNRSPCFFTSCRSSGSACGAVCEAFLLSLLTTLVRTGVWFQPPLTLIGSTQRAPVQRAPGEKYHYTQKYYQLIPKQYRFDNFSTEITEHNSQTFFGKVPRDSAIHCSHTSPRSIYSGNRSVR